MLKISTEQVIELTDENKMLQNQLDTQSKHENEMQNLRSEFADLKCNTSNKSSEEDIKQMQSKILELQDANAALNGEVEPPIKIRRRFSVI